MPTALISAEHVRRTLRERSSAGDPNWLAPDGITRSDQAALLRVIWQEDVVAKLLRAKTYEYALLALAQLRRGKTRGELWLERSAPGGVVFNDAFTALEAAGLIPEPR